MIITLAAGCTYSVSSVGFTGSVGPDAFAAIDQTTGKTPEPESVTISGSGDTISLGTTARFFEVDAGASLTLSDLTLTGGDDASGFGGGAVWNAGSLTADSVVFSDDRSLTDGGAVDSGDGVPANSVPANSIVSTVLDNDTFTSDTAGAHGGAVDNADGEFGPGNTPVGAGTLTVTDSTFTDDSVAPSKAMVLVAHQVQPGPPADGGAIDNADAVGTGSATITGSLFDSDSVVGTASTEWADGGAIDNGDNGGTGALSVTTSTFEKNQVTNVDAQPGTGGAIDVADEDGNGSLTLTDSTFFSNRATTDGGAVADFGSGYLVASTFDANTTASQVGNTLETSASQTAAADLIASDHPACDTTSFGPPAEGGSNLVSDSTCGIGPTPVADLGTYLVALQNNGGPTPTLALSLPGDPAVAAIAYGTTSPAGLSSYPKLCPRTDQTGFTSPAGAACAVGAYEPRPAVAAPLPPAPAPSPPTASISWPLPGATLAVGAVVDSSFSCTEGAGGPGIATCVDQAGKQSGSAIDTSTTGPHTLKVTATSKDGLTGSASVVYQVVAVPTLTPPRAPLTAASSQPATVASSRPVTAASSRPVTAASSRPVTEVNSELPFTGARTTLAGGLSLLLLGVGAGLVRLSRRPLRRR